MEHAANEGNASQSRSRELEAREENHPDLAGWFIGTAPSDTLDACANVCRFIGVAVDSIEHAGMSLDRRSADAVCRIMDMVADVIEWEGARVQYRRKTEAEIEAAEAEAGE